MSDSEQFMSDSEQAQSNSEQFVSDSEQFVSNSEQVGRRGGLMVSALDSGSGGPGSSPDRVTALCSWARHFTLIVPLSTQVYKMGTGEFTAGGNPAMD